MLSGVRSSLKSSSELEAIVVASGKVELGIVGFYKYLGGHVLAEVDLGSVDLELWISGLRRQILDEELGQSLLVDLVDGT